VTKQEILGIDASELAAGADRLYYWRSKRRRHAESNKPAQFATHMMKQLTTLIVALAALAGASLGAGADSTSPTNVKTAIFAGGCFWCMQPPYDQAKGVVKTVVGYTGGNETDANYQKVSAHQTKHREAIQVTYDPAQISYDQLLDIFWRQINPTQADGQFHDIGLSYQAAIYYGNEEEKKLAETSKERLDKSGRFQKPIVTEVLPALNFYPAEDYHQKYYLKNPSDFEAYHVGSGRVSFLEKIWGEAAKK
jgi:methionine-S-sulfoxide reductase